MEGNGLGEDGVSDVDANVSERIRQSAVYDFYIQRAAE